MIVGMPSEVKADEYRVAMTPAGVRELTSAGHTVLVEKGAGDGSSMPDDDFVRTGAKILDDADEVWGAADLVCKVKEPVAEEYHRLGPAQGPDPLHLPAPGRLARVHRRPGRAGNVAIAYETVRLTDNSLPLLAPMSEVAGRMAPLMGAHHLMRPGGGAGRARVRRARGALRPRGHSRGRGGRASRPPPWPWACTPTCTSSTATSTGCARSTTTSGAALETMASSAARH